MKHHDTFATNEACESYLKENGERDNKLIVEMAASNGVAVSVKLVCTADKAQDNTI